MKTQYSITIVKRVPKSEEELDRINKHQSDMFHYGQHNQPMIDERTYNERDVLCTVLSEDEFIKVRTEILRNWDK